MRISLSPVFPGDHCETGGSLRAATSSATSASDSPASSGGGS